MGQNTRREITIGRYTVSKYIGTMIMTFSFEIILSRVDVLRYPFHVGGPFAD